jgi:hypothetical protein
LCPYAVSTRGVATRHGDAESSKKLTKDDDDDYDLVAD